MSANDPIPAGRISPFEQIKHTDEGNEFWSARELGKVLGYGSWQSFHAVIERAINICECLYRDTAIHFQADEEIVAIGKGAGREIINYRLTRYAAYLILLCGDVKKPEVVHALAYIALETIDDVAREYDDAALPFIPEPRNIAVTKEQKTIGLIMRAFQHLHGVQHYSVAPYFVDLYFPDQRIAVECDEKGHREYSSAEEATRQNHIERTLRCKFVRYNPDAHEFNIGDVINRIMLLLYGQPAIPLHQHALD